MNSILALLNAVAVNAQLVLLVTGLCFSRHADTRSLLASQNLYTPKPEQGMAWRYDVSHTTNLSTVQIKAEQVMLLATGILAQ